MEFSCSPREVCLPTSAVMLLAKSLCKHPLNRFLRISGGCNAWRQERLISDDPAFKELYRILGVSPKATQTEIKDAYYNLTMKFHPDRNEGSPEAAIKFREVTEAYEVLGNYFMRKRYDKGLPLPMRHETVTTEVTVPHVVKYQKFFDSRNLPYLPSAYTAGGGATRFDEYTARQPEDRRLREAFAEDLEFQKMCRERKMPSFLALFVLMYMATKIREEFGIEAKPLVTVDAYERFR